MALIETGSPSGDGTAKITGGANIGAVDLPDWTVGDGINGPVEDEGTGDGSNGSGGDSTNEQNPGLPSENPLDEFGDIGTGSTMPVGQDPVGDPSRWFEDLRKIGDDTDETNGMGNQDVVETTTDKELARQDCETCSKKKTGKCTTQATTQATQTPTQKVGATTQPIPIGFFPKSVKEDIGNLLWYTLAALLAYAGIKLFVL